MKTTIDIPDTVFRQVKARAALGGRTMRAFVLEAIREKLEAKTSGPEESPKGWRAVFGKAPKGSVDEVQAVIDREFSRIDPKDWK